MITTATDVVARMKLGAALTHDDIAGFYQLAAKTLDAQTLGLGIAAVTCAAACFLVCHYALLTLWISCQWFSFWRPLSFLEPLYPRLPFSSVPVPLGPK